MTNRSLSEALSHWRADRPDEWKMDEFIRQAKSQEVEVAELVAANKGLFHALEVSTDTAGKLREENEKLRAFAREVADLTNDELNSIPWSVIFDKHGISKLLTGEEDD